MNADASRITGRDRGPARGSTLAGAWHTSSHSRGEDCVEVTVTTDTSAWPHKADAEKLYLMRDAKKPDGPVLAFTPAEWEAFVLGVKDGEFDIADGEFENPP